MAEKANAGTAKTDDAALPRKITPIAPSAMELFEQRATVWSVKGSAGATREDIEKPEYWSVVSDKLRPGDMLWHKSHDGRWLAEVLIVDAEKGFATHAEILRVIDLPDLSLRNYSEVPPGYALRQDVHTQRWSAVRLKDEVPLVREQLNRADALRELRAHATLRDPANRPVCG